MKRILIFSLNYYPFVGGAEVAIKEITDRIPSSDIEFHLIALRLDTSLPLVEKRGNVLVHRIGFAAKNPTMSDLKKFPLHLNKYYFQIAAWLKAEQLHANYHYDATWAMMAHSCGIPAALFKTFHKEVPYLLTLQEGDPLPEIERTMKLVWPVFIRGFTLADYLQPISTYLYAWGTRMGFKGAAVEVIPNAVDVAHFKNDATPGSIGAFEEKLGKKSGDVYVVTTSRLVHKNAIDDVIRALPLLPERVSFLIYGIGPDEDMLKALAKELKVEHRARFMGQLDHADMPTMLQSCDIFIRPSRSEGMGNSFVEAMAARIPVIGTQEGGISDFLYDAKRNPDKAPTGWAVDVGSPRQIAETVTYIMEHPTESEETSVNAFALVQHTYEWNTVATSMKALFERMEKAG